MNLRREQHDRMIEFLDEILWGDYDLSLRIVEETLRRLLEATREHLEIWDESEDLVGDEFSVTLERVDELGLRDAYVSRLVYTLALMYDLDERDSPARSVGEVARQLNDIAEFVVQDDFK
jgi:hypothetical protein